VFGLFSNVRARVKRGERYPTWVLVVALSGMFATTFPVTILAVSLGDIADDLHTTETVLAWVISAPLLASALALPILGKMGDLYGQRRVFLVGFTGATAISILVALSWNAGSLIAFRTLALVVGAATQPTSLALVVGVYSALERVKALGWWSLVAAGAPSVGLAVGGPLVDLVGWRYLFVIQSGLGLIVLAAAALVLSEVRRHEPVRFDVRGSVALTVGTGSLLLLLSKGPEWGLTHPVMLISAVLAPIALSTFFAIERTAPAPLLPLTYFRVRNFAAPQVCSLFLGAAYMGGFILAPLLMRFVLGYSLSQTAFVMILRPLTFSLSSPIGGRLAMRVGERVNATAGTGMMTAALGVFAIGAWQHSLPLVIAGLVLQGVGNGVARPSLTASLTNSVDQKDVGIAAASNRMLHQIGASFGIAVLTAIYAGSRAPAPFARAYLVGALLALASMVAASFVRSADRKRAKVAEEPFEVAATG
jgi:EmrB/QacA subfamily drug resistance transporter